MTLLVLSAGTVGLARSQSRSANRSMTPFCRMSNEPLVWLRPQHSIWQSENANIDIESGTTLAGHGKRRLNGIGRWVERLPANPDSPSVRPKDPRLSKVLPTACAIVPGPRWIIFGG